MLFSFINKSTIIREELMSKTKPYAISKNIVYEAYLKVKANKGSARIDEFEGNLKDNLYKIWNRMSSGSYFPPAVKAVEIPKKAGGTRILGIPTVADRIAQMTVKLYFEPSVEPYFHEDSYGYRPRKSAIQALEITRKRCWRYNRSEEHTSELQSRGHLVCRLLLEKKKAVTLEKLRAAQSTR